MQSIKIVLAGEGGQGVQSIAGIISQAAFDQGYQALYIPNFGVEQRGGVSVAFIQISTKMISSLKFPKADVIVALSDRAVLRTKQYVDEHTTFLYDTSVNADLVQKQITGAGKIIPIPAMEIVKEKFHPRVFNVLIMGTLIPMTDFLDYDAVADVLVKKLQYKFDQDPGLKQMNLDALKLGEDYLQDLKQVDVR